MDKQIYNIFIVKERNKTCIGHKNNLSECIAVWYQHVHFYKVKEYVIEILNQQIYL
jgi:hypothetical protein